MNCDIIKVKIIDCKTSTFVEMNIINKTNPTPNLMSCLSLGDDSIYDVVGGTDVDNFVVIKNCSAIDKNVMELIDKYYEDNNMDYDSYPLFYIQNTKYQQLDMVKAKLVYYGFETADHLFNTKHLTFLIKTSRETHRKLCDYKYFDNCI